MAEAKVLNHIKIPAKEILEDYRITVLSRETSLIGRKEVFMGKAKFGIFGDGKEVPQLAMARVFRNGDHRSGYYRDQTFMLAIGELTVQQYFAQLFAHTDIEADPSSAGRLMNSHFATRMLDPAGNWLKQTELKNSSSDISPTGAQMSRLIGLAFASKLYRNNPDLKDFEDFSDNGNEIAFGTIGNAATSEGCFFEAVNAAGVLQVPMVLSVWDDGYGISVPNKYHTIKEDIGKAMKGFQREGDGTGLEIFQVKGWDYIACVEVFEKAASLAREQHIPSLIHFTELTQPLGHSTSGSHERYKSKERLEWENKFDCNKKFREWILENQIASEEELERIEKETKLQAKTEKERAWAEYLESIKHDQIEAAKIITTVAQKSKYRREILSIKAELSKIHNPLKLDFFKAVKKTLILTRKEKIPQRQRLINWLSKINDDNQKFYSSHLYSESENSSLNIKLVQPVYSEKSKNVDGREVLQAFF